LFFIALIILLFIAFNPLFFSIFNLGKDNQKTLSLVKKTLKFFNVRNFSGWAGLRAE